MALGRRQVIADIESTLIGMKIDGHRTVRIGPYSACRAKGAPDLIPSDAVLVVELWGREVVVTSGVVRI